MNKEILRLAIPNVLTNLTVPLVSLVDLALMGHMPMTSTIVAIGLGTMLFNFLYWSFGFLRMGTTGITAQAFGSRNASKLIETLYRASLVAVLAGFLLILFKHPIAELAIRLIDPAAAVEPLIYHYFSIRIYAAPATIAIYAITGWLLGMQDSKGALRVAITVGLVNALLSTYLVLYANTGIKGVAGGTVFAQYAGLLIAILWIKKKHFNWFLESKISRSSLRRGWKEFLGVNGDIFVRTLCLVFALSFFKTKAGNAGLLLGAANILLLEFISISAYGIDGFAFAAESICGKYFGQNKARKFQEAVRRCFVWGIGVALVFALSFWLFGWNILSLLTDKIEVITKAMDYLPWLIIAPVTSALAFIWDGIFIGATASRWMRNSMLLSVFFIFLPSFYFFNWQYGNHGIWLALNLFMLSRGLIQSGYYKRHILARFKQSL